MTVFATIAGLLSCGVGPPPEVKPGEPAPFISLRVGGPIYGVTFSPKMDRVAVLRKGRQVHVYDFPELRLLGNFECAGASRVMDLSPCGQYLLTEGQLDADGSADVWDVDAKPAKRIHVLRQRQDQVDEYRGNLCSLSFLADSRRVLALDGFPRLHVWDWRASARAIAEVSFPDKRISAARFLGPDTLLAYEAALERAASNARPAIPLAALGGRERQKDAQKSFCAVYRFDGKKLSLLRSLGIAPPLAGSVGVSPDGKTLAIWDPKERAIDLHDLAQPKPEVVDQVLNYWRPWKEGELIGIRGLAVTNDRSVVALSYSEMVNNSQSRHVLAFFPRTPARYKDFGLDVKKQSHLAMAVQWRRAVCRSRPTGNGSCCPARINRRASGGSRAWVRRCRGRRT